MKRMVKILYNLIGIHLPDSQTKVFGEMSRKIREVLFNKIMNNKGKNINVQGGVKVNGKIILGNNSGIGRNSVLNGKITIGDNVMIGPEVHMYARNHKTSDTSIPMIKQGFEEMKEIIIGDDVWIRSKSYNSSRSKIGNGCIIGAGAVVTKSFDDYCVIGGNPAKLLKKRKEN